MLLLLFVSRNGTNLFDVIKYKSEKCEETKKKSWTIRTMTVKFHVLTNGAKCRTDWLHEKIESLFHRSGFSVWRWLRVNSSPAIEMFPMIQFFHVTLTDVDKQICFSFFINNEANYESKARSVCLASLLSMFEKVSNTNESEVNWKSFYIVSSKKAEICYIWHFRAHKTFEFCHKRDNVIHHKAKRSFMLRGNDD